MSREVPSGPLTVLGRLPDSSNNALLCSISERTGPVRVVYKPVAGERPLWDFPSGTLTRREKAAAVLDDLLGWDLVPSTRWIDEGPAGPGILQVWIDGRIDIAVFEPGQVPAGWVDVVDAETDQGPVVVAHRTDEQTCELIAFDVICNNADRKGGHLLRSEDRLFAIDHGVTFHDEPKLRTVLWGLMNTEIPGAVLSSVEAALDSIVPALTPWLSQEEALCTRQRAEALLASGRFPAPSGQWPALPWPLI